MYRGVHIWSTTSLSTAIGHSSGPGDLEGFSSFNLLKTNSGESVMVSKRGHRSGHKFQHMGEVFLSKNR